MGRPRAARWRHTRFRWPTSPPTRRQRAPSESRCRSPRHGGPRSQRNAPYMQPSTTQVGRCWNILHGTRCTPPPQWKTRRWPPTSSRGGHGAPRGMPRTPSAPHPRRLATRRPRRTRRRRPERPRGLAVQPNKGPSPRDWLPCPPVGPTGSGLPTPHGPRTPRKPGCSSGPCDDAGTGQLTPGGRRGRRPLAPLLKPAQRSRPTGPVPPGHTPTAPGAGGLYR